MRFAEFARSRASMPFEWGKNDCCLFAADCVAAMTDVDPAAEMRGYSTALAANRLVHAEGGLQAMATRFLGVPVSPKFAAVGDVVLLENEGRQLLGVCNGTSVVGPGPDGLAVLSMEAAAAAWKV